MNGTDTRGSRDVPPPTDVSKHYILTLPTGWATHHLLPRQKFGNESVLMHRTKAINTQKENIRRITAPSPPPPLTHRISYLCFISTFWYTFPSFPLLSFFLFFFFFCFNLELSLAILCLRLPYAEQT